MPIINDLDLEYREPLVDISVIYVSLGTVFINPDTTIRTSLGAMETIAVFNSDSEGALDLGEIFQDESLGLIDAGLPSKGDSFGGLDTDGNIPASLSFGGLDVNQVIAVTSAAGALEASKELLTVSQGAISTQGKPVSNSASGLNIRKGVFNEAAGALEIGLEEKGLGQGGLNVGGRKDEIAIGSIEIDAADSVPVIIDVIDATLNGGRGDC
jgi:hypothetical protein